MQARRYQSLFDFEQLFVKREHLRVALIFVVNFRHGLHGFLRSDLDETSMQNAGESPRVFTRFKLSLGIDNDHARARSIECDSELAQFRLNLHLPERAQVESATPQRHVRTS